MQGMKIKNAPRHLLNLLDLGKDEVSALLKRTKTLKREQKLGKSHQPLLGKSLGMIFEKKSTRTRVSFEVGIFQLGGQAIYLSPEHMQLGRGELLKDTARVLSRYLDGIIVRGNRHADLEELAKWSSVPVINALTDLYHPCQILSDLFTIKSAGVKLEKMKLAFIGDPNNVFNDWVNACALLGFELRLASPPGYQPDPRILKSARKAGPLNLKNFNDPGLAVKTADVLYTDVWVSMGQEKEMRKRLKDFQGYQINRNLLNKVGKKALVLHCLPAHPGQEISEEVFENHAGIIFEQAENRLHTQKAILEFFIKSRGAACRARAGQMTGLGRASPALTKPEQGK